MQDNKVLQQLIQTRRSIKPEQYTDVPVADTIISTMLESAQWAPTHARTEPWRFVVLSGAGLQRFTAFQAEVYKRTTPEEQFNPLKYEKLAAGPLKASHLILIGMKRQETEKLPVMEEIAAVACAVQNMLLTAHAEGVGAYWSTGGITYHPEMLQFMDLGPKDLCMGMLYVGNFDTPAPDGKRSGMENKVRWDQ